MCDLCFYHVVGRQETLHGLRQMLSLESSHEPTVGRGNCCSLRNYEIDFSAIADLHVGLDGVHNRTKEEKTATWQN